MRQRCLESAPLLISFRGIGELPRLTLVMAKGGIPKELTVCRRGVLPVFQCGNYCVKFAVLIFVASVLMLAVAASAISETTRAYSIRS